MYTYWCPHLWSKANLFMIIKCVLELVGKVLFCFRVLLLLGVMQSFNIALLISWEFHIMYPNSTFLPVSPMWSPHPCSVLQKENFKNSQGKASKQTKTRTKPTNLFISPTSPPLQYLFIHLGGFGDLRVSHSIPFCPINFIGKCSLQCDLRPLVSSAPSHWILTGLLRNIPWPPWVTEILWVLFHSPCPFASSSRF